MIPTGLYDAYATALTENDRQARAALAAIMAQLDFADVDGVRDALLEAYPALVRLYGTRAAQVAVEFYAGVREAQQVGAWFRPELPAESEIYDEPEAVADVRREVRGLYSGKSTLEAFTSTMQGLATKRTMAMADTTLIQLANADPAKPRWAFVPHPGACGWCVMIGSRGFDYSRKKSADNMRHDHCRCTVVADFDEKNPGLEGYDPDAMADAYLRCREAVEEDAKRRWRGMSAGERAQYTRKGSNKPSYDVYLRNRIAGEMNTRDRGWLQNPRTKLPEPRKLDGAKPLLKEERTEELLRGCGFRVEFRQMGEKRTSDTYFVSGKNQDALTSWEFKCPDGNSDKAVKNQLKSAVGIKGKSRQCERVVISNASELTSLSFEDLCNQTSSLFEAGRFMEISQVLIVSTDGRLKRYTH